MINMMDIPVIVFIWANIDRFGGGRTFLFHCLRRLPRMGYMPVVLDAGPFQRPLDEEARAFGPSIVRVPRRRFERESRYWSRVHAQIEKLKPSLLFFGESRFAEDILRSVSPGLPAVNLCLVDRPDENYYRHAAALAPRMAATIGNSPVILERLKKAMDPQCHSRVHHLMIGVDIPSSIGVRTLRKPIRIIFMARLNRKPKRAHDLIPFARQLTAAGTGYQLTVVGEGEEAPALREALDGEIKSGAVVMTGPLPLHQAMSVLDEQDVLVMFSEYEGLPLVLLEALARGVVPVVSRMNGGIEDMITHEVSGLLFPVGEPEIAAAQTAQLAANPELYGRLSRGAVDLGRKYSLDRTFADLGKILGAVMPESAGINHAAGETV